MAVDAQRLCDMLLGAGHHQPSPAMPMSGAAAAFSPYGAAAGSQQPCMGGPVTRPPPPTLAAQDQYTETDFLADLAKRSVRRDGSQEMIAGYKRKRDEQSPSPPVFGAANALAAHAQQQTIAVDRILLKHAAKMSTALAEQRERDTGLIIYTVEARAAKRLKAKDEEIERARGMNWALQERLRNLYVVAQMWHDMARSNEAVANVLRRDLQRALDVQAARGGGGGGDAEDASSCCWGDNRVAFS